MSVAFTEQAVVERRKTVTRRAGWWRDTRGKRLVRPGDTLELCRKVMGRKEGEPLVRLCEVEVISVTRERLDAITQREVELEGFPDMTPAEFIERFFTPQRILPRDLVTRIEWRYLDTPEGASV